MRHRHETNRVQIPHCQISPSDTHLLRHFWTKAGRSPALDHALKSCPSRERARSNTAADGVSFSTRNADPRVMIRARKVHARHPRLLIRLQVSLAKHDPMSKKLAAKAQPLFATILRQARSDCPILQM